MSSAAGGYGGGSGGEDQLGAEHHHHDAHAALGHLFRHYHAQHAAAEAAGQLCHVPQHSRREKLRFPLPDGGADSPPPALAPQHMSGAWPPPAYYSYASSSSYSPHSPTLAQGQLVAPQGFAAQQLQQIPTQNFSLSLSSASSNLPPTPRRHTAGPPVLGTGPYGPFTGYATVLGRSRFLAPAQKLLEEICDVAGAAAHVDRSVPDEGLLDVDSIDGADASLHHELDRAGGADAGPMSGAEQQWKKTKLISMMEEVCKRYRQYYQQIQAVIASFETVAGFSNVAPFAAMALRTMAKHFRCLKGMILKQLRSTSTKVTGKEGASKDTVVFGLSGGAGGFPIGDVNLSYGQPHNIWRPQRGLPERAVSVLRAWLFDNFLHPYPSDGDKQMLAKQTGLTRNQVSNWFINARVRLWKPMVEEIHNLEMRQIHKHSGLDKGQHGVHHQSQHSLQQQQQQQQRSGKRSEPCDSQPGQSSSITRNHTAAASQGFPDELSHMSHSIQDQVSLAYNALTSQHSMASPSRHHHHQQAGAAVAGYGGSAAAGAGNGSVSLTLGLHQNNMVCFPEPLQQGSTLAPNLAHRFGLEDVNDAYVMSSFGGQDRHFAKEIGGHLLHDFVG